MKINLPTEPKKTRFGDIPEGACFWCDGSLFMKPEIAGCIHELKSRLLALNLTLNTLTAFDGGGAVVIPELHPMKVSYDDELGDLEEAAEEAENG